MSDCATSFEVVEEFVRNESLDVVSQLYIEVTDLLGGEISNNFISENKGNYNPSIDGLTTGEWFVQVQKLLFESLAGHGV